MEQTGHSATTSDAPIGLASTEHGEHSGRLLWTHLPSLDVDVWRRVVHTATTRVGTGLANSVGAFQN